MQVETRAVESLKPHPRNYRAHPDRQVALIAESLRTLKQFRPIVIQPDGMILAGHGVVEAAKAEGLTEIEVIVYDGPHPEKVLVADNQTARLAIDDDAALAELLEKLRAEDDLTGTGFDDDGLEELLEKIRADSILSEGKELDESIADDVKQVECPFCGKEFPL